MNRIKQFLLDKDFYRGVMTLGLPIAAQNLLSSSAGLIDTIMVGQLGEISLSAVGLAGQWSFFMFLFFFGFSSGSSVFFSQYWGVKDLSRIRHTYSLGFVNVLLISLLFLAVGYCFPDTVIRIFTNDETVVKEGVLYLRIAVFAYIAQCVNTYGCALLRATEEVRLPMVANILSVLTNTFLNWVFIYGNLGAPRMGVRGAALATVISAWVCAFIVIIASYRNKNLLAMPIKEFFHIRLSTVKRFYPVVLPVVFNESLWAMASMCLNMVYGRLGTGNYSAMTVKNTIENLAFTFFVGLSSACSVMVGKSIGAGDYKRGFTDARRFGLLSPLLAILLGVVLVALRVPLTNLFTLSSEVKVTAQWLIIINACIYPMRMFNHMNIVGTFRAGGDTKASLVMDAGCIWLLSVPLVALAGLVWRLPFIAVFSMTAVEELVKFTVGMWYLNTGKWIKPVTGKKPASPAESLA
jgi:putative MATE family efflux protein